MLEYLEIEEFSFVSNDKIKIWVKDGKVHYSLYFLRNCKEVNDEISNCAPESLEKMLVALQITAWKKTYEPNMMYMDGTSWTVKYKECGGKEVKYSGENAWPRNWKAFLSIIKVITGDLGGLE